MGYFFVFFQVKMKKRQKFKMVRQNTPKQYQTRLHLRDHTYYIRVAVPKALKTLEKRNEIRYSLGTKDYFTAIERLRRENYL